MLGIADLSRVSFVFGLLLRLGEVLSGGPTAYFVQAGETGGLGFVWWFFFLLASVTFTELEIV